MKNISKFSILIFATFLTGCESTPEPQANFKVSSLPEHSAHMECLGRQAAIYSKANGSPLELGIIASSACNGTRYALHRAIEKSNGKYFAQGYTESSEKEDPKLIAGLIAKSQAGQDPFQ